MLALYCFVLLRVQSIHLKRTPSKGPALCYLSKGLSKSTLQWGRITWMQKDFKQHFTVFEYFLLQPQFLIISFNNQMTEKESKLSNAVRVIQEHFSTRKPHDYRL